MHIWTKARIVCGKIAPFGGWHEKTDRLMFILDRDWDDNNAADEIQPSELMCAYIFSCAWI